MFLKATEHRNPKLIDFAVQLHQEGKILPDTFVLDLDSIIGNAKKISEVALEKNIELFFMAKQIGRNPLIAKKISEQAIEKAVVVDYKEALVMMNANIPLGNVGHLVQIPSQLLKQIMTYGADYLTVFSMDKIKQIIEIAKQENIVQKLLLKVVEPSDWIYEGQNGGFRLSELHDVVALLKNESSVKIAGITSFPCFLIDDNQELSSTHNLRTLLAAKKILEEEGLSDIEMNMPSATCAWTISAISEFGGTQGEPGHALTGTTPMHAVRELAEIPAMVYVSEISHNMKDKSYIFGGGYYRRGHFENVKVFQNGMIEDDRINSLSPESIDYYIELNKNHPVGSTVIGAFRTQIFVTRSDVAIVEGLHNGAPRLVGIYDSLGNRIGDDRLG
ncbi:MAG: YhfX family PLP-dependent enzyme [Aerococcaceae bacterium]|nr:YhfX family PLP-dependent enzyme [Aerococcaceae bacterium]